MQLLRLLGRLEEHARLLGANGTVVTPVDHEQRTAHEPARRAPRIGDRSNERRERRFGRQIAARGQGDRANQRIVTRDDHREIGAQ